MPSNNCYVNNMIKIIMPLICLTLLLLANYHYSYADQKSNAIQYSLCQANVEDAKVIPSRDKFSVYIQLTKSATKELSKITEENINKRMTVLIDTDLVVQAIIRAKIDSGAISSNDTSKEEAMKLRERILHEAPIEPCGLIN